MEATQEPVCIYAYLDLVKYLGAMYEFRKRASTAFSFRAFSRRAGLRSPNHLKRVMDGERPLTESMAPRYALALALDLDETDYFCLLAAFSRARTLNEKNLVYRKLSAQPGYQQRHAGAVHQQIYDETWYMPVIREMGHMPDFRGDPEEVAARLLPPIAPEEATRALDTLLELGMLARDPDGRLRPVDTVLASGEEVGALSIANFLRAMLVRASGALDVVPLADRQFTALTFGIDEEGVEEVRRRIEVFRRDLIGYITGREAPTQRVVNFSMQLFPVTQQLDQPQAKPGPRRAMWWATGDAPPFASDDEA